MNPQRVFLPLVQTRSPEVRYWDLSNYKFSAAEKTFLVGEILGTTNILPPTHINLTDGHTNKSCRGFAERYGIPRSTVTYWHSVIVAGDILYDDGGRPVAVDEIGLHAIEDRIKASMTTTATVAIHNFSDVVRHERAQTLRRHGKHILPGAEPSVSESLVAKVRKLTGVIARKPAPLSQARLTALRDIRAAYRVACMFEAFGGHLPDTNKWNADPTQLLIQKNGAGELQCYIHHDDQKFTKKFDSSTVPDPMGIIVKWLAMASAAGDSSPIALIIPLPELDASEYLTYTVPGLTAQAFGPAGTIYFARTRNGCPSLWKHYYLNIVIPTLRASLERYDARDSVGALLRILFYTDGELQVINEVFDEEVLAGFRSVLTDYLKGEPGGTSAWQMLDNPHAGFRDLKTLVRTITKTKSRPVYEFLRRSLAHMFAQLEADRPTLTVSGGFKDRVIHACEVILHAMCSGAITPDKFRKAFLETGQHKVVRNPGESSVSYEKIIGTTLAQNITEEEFNTMRLSKPAVVAEFRARGKVLNTFLDQLGIVKGEDAPDRDNFGLARKDCLLLTHEE